jgi:hypothetical protein
MAHTFDLALMYVKTPSKPVNVDNPVHYSQNDTEFRKVWRSSQWNQIYNRDYIVEAFAESFAYYFDSQKSRNIQRDNQPLVFDYFKKRFGG